jgi:hypothetical protein
MGRKGAGRREERGEKEGRWVGPAVGKGLDRLGLFFFKSILNNFSNIFLNSNLHLFNSNFYTSFYKNFHNYFKDF